MTYRLVIEPQQKQDDRLSLTPQQQHYLIVVLRMKQGDRFVAMDGQGKAWLAEIVGNSAKIIEEIAQSTELPVAITLIAALPKGNGFDEVVRSCTELGVTTFMPVISDRTLLKPSPNKLDRWRKIATEAAEQSERQIVPAILEPIKFTEAIDMVVDSKTDCYICVARGNISYLWNCLSQHQPDKSTIVIAIGAEGGWTEKEIQSACALGFQPVSLGRRILRAVTAPIAAVSLVVAAIEC
ncbi:MAG: 16S rRNA (uracil(1498)-N(3))-methyltransferase [Xenococcaceae cyanobacterium]